jgi:uncharacterized protein YcsI (UPF0317 family)
MGLLYLYLYHDLVFSKLPLAREIISLKLIKIIWECSFSMLAALVYTSLEIQFLTHSLHASLYRTTS